LEVGKNGRKYVEKNHDSIVIAQKLVDVYKTYHSLRKV
jgi:hypothetical protein